MVSLIDIAPSIETVQGVEVPGLSGAGIAYLFQRFPELRMYVTGKGSEITTDQLIKLAPDAVAAIIAAGTGHPGEPEHETAAARLNVNSQVDFLTAILKVSLPGGVDPFVAKFNALAGALGMDAAPAVASGKVPAGKSPPPLKS